VFEFCGAAFIDVGAGLMGISDSNSRRRRLIT
jgi:hypothetical protein